MLKTCPRELGTHIYIIILVLVHASGNKTSNGLHHYFCHSKKYTKKIENLNIKKRLPSICGHLKYFIKPSHIELQ